MSFNKRAALALLPQLSWALVARQAVSCSFSTAASNGDTCDSFSNEWGLTVAQFEGLNPGVNCPGNLVAGQSYCVVGTVASGQPTTTSAAHTTLITTISTSTSSSTTSKPVASNQPQQTGIPSNCNKFYKVGSGDTCSSIENKFSISSSEFDSWNPSLNSDCTNLLAGYYYCVSVPGATTVAPPPATTTTPSNGITTPSPVQSGIASNCNKFDLVKSGDTCDSITSAAGVSLSDFYNWNPAVGSDCSSLWTGYNVCVGVVGYTPTPTTTNPGNGVATPTPYEPGMVGNCNAFYLVRSGDSCYSISQSQGVSVADIEQWNPKVGSDCSDLWLNDYICVGVQ